MKTKKKNLWFFDVGHSKSENYHKIYFYICPSAVKRKAHTHPKIYTLLKGVVRVFKTIFIFVPDVSKDIFQEQMSDAR